MSTLLATRVTGQGRALVRIHSKWRRSWRFQRICDSCEKAYGGYGCEARQLGERIVADTSNIWPSLTNTAACVRAITFPREPITIRPEWRVAKSEAARQLLAVLMTPPQAAPARRRPSPRPRVIEAVAVAA